MSWVADYPEIEEGNQLAADGHHEAAIAKFEEARFRGARLLAVNISNSLFALSRAHDAENVLRAGWIDERDLDAGFNLAVHLQDSDVEGSREVYRELVRRGYGKAAVNEAWNLWDEGRGSEAETVLETFVETDGSVDRDIAAGALGTMLFRRGDLAKAQPFLEEGATRDPGARADLGHVLLATGDSRLAREVWERGAEAGEVESMVPLANLLAEDGDAQRARQLYRAAAARGDGHAATNLAIDLWNSGKFDQARHWIDRGEELGDAVAQKWNAELRGSPA